MKCTQLVLFWWGGGSLNSMLARVSEAFVNIVLSKAKNVIFKVFCQSMYRNTCFNKRRALNAEKYNMKSLHRRG